VTPDEERELLSEVADTIDRQARTALGRLVALIREGVPARDAVDQVMGTLSPAVGQVVVDALTAIVGTASAVVIQAATLQLSQKLYAEAQSTSVVVQGIVQRHAAGFQDARALARDLFEGYAFRPPDAEPIRLAASNPKLPKYLREALLPDRAVGDNLARAFAKIQVSDLKTDALKAAYSELLEAIDSVEAGAGRALLDKRLEVAFYERMRYFAQRIAQTELHRAYAQREARLILNDQAVEFVQVRRAPLRTDPCICSLLTGRDLYGIGAGVYPKSEAPVPPFHPFCRCVMAPRLDLSGRQPRPRDDDADAYFLRRLDAPIAARVMGSQAKRDRVFAGDTAEDVANDSRDPLYWIKPAAEVG
jgi:hypothetical protein